MTDNPHYINHPGDPLGEPFQPHNQETDQQDLKPFLNIEDWGLEQYQGQAQPQRFLLEGMFPAGSPSLLCAMGDTGKGMLILDTALRITNPEVDQKTAFGTFVQENGSVVIFSAEDDRDEIHRRLENLDPQGLRNACANKLYIIPLPNAGGSFSLVERDNRRNLTHSLAFTSICTQLEKIENLKLVVFDPLSSFIHEDMNDASVASFIMSIFAEIAAKTQAAVIIPCHVRKTNSSKEVETPAEARQSVRGSTALIDGTRFAYAFWTASAHSQKQIIKCLGSAVTPYSLYQGAVIKANSKADRKMRTYLRSADTGLLEDITEQIVIHHNEEVLSIQELEEGLLEAIKNAANSSFPFTKTGLSGLYTQRERLPKIFHALSKHKLEELAQSLLEQEKIVRCVAQNSSAAKWLDVPDGVFARGEGEFIYGAATASDDDHKARGQKSNNTPLLEMVETIL